MFVCLFVLFLELESKGKDLLSYCFSLAPGRMAVLFIYCDFDVVLHFILSFTIFSCHSVYDQFILTDFMAVQSEQNVLVAP